MTEGAIQPFSDFVKALYTASFDEMRSRPGAAVESPEAFEQMRQYLIERYDGVEVPHSFLESGGEVVDSTPYEQQPSLKNGGDRTVVAPPESLPRGPDGYPEPPDSAPPTRIPPPHLHPDYRDRFGNQMLCPDGTVPLVRTTIERLCTFGDLDTFLRGGRVSQEESTDQSAATSFQGKVWGNGYDTRDNFGGSSFINVWSAAVFGPQSSASQQWYTSGSSPGDPFQTVECGYRIGTPFRNVPTLFIASAINGYDTLCYNTDCSRFTYKPNARQVLGAQLQASQPGSENQIEYEMGFVLTEGRWWFHVSGEWIGSYKASLFEGGALATGAKSAGFGGEVGGAGAAFPAMGSGVRPAAGLGKAAVQRGVFRNVTAQTAEPAVLSPGNFTMSNCYGPLDIRNNTATSWHTYLLFGGPGGLNC